MQKRETGVLFNSLLTRAHAGNVNINTQITVILQQKKHLCFSKITMDWI